MNKLRFLVTILILMSLPLAASAQEGGWLGVGLDSVEGDAATALGFAHPVVRVSRVFPLSPAESAGIRVDDIVVQYQGQAIDAPQTLVSAVGTTPANTEVALVLSRAGETVESSVTLAPRPDFEELARRYLLNNPARPVAASYAQGAEGSVDLGALSGDVVLIDFWATTCGPCLMSIPRLNEMQARYGDQGLRIIGISNEEEAMVTEAIDTFGIQYPIAIDQAEATGQEYLITAYPTMVLIDRSGTVREVHIGAADLDALETQVTTLLAAQ